MEDFLKNLGIYGSIVRDESKKFAQSVADKGKEIAEVARLKKEIKIEENMIKSYKMVIGEYVAANDLLQEDELVFEQKTKIHKSLGKIDELKEKLEEITKKEDKQ